MSTDDKEPIQGYSADYRGAHPQKPKAERPAPKKRAPEKAKAAPPRKSAGPAKKAEPPGAEAPAPGKNARAEEAPASPRADGRRQPKKRRAPATKADGAPAETSVPQEPETPVTLPQSNMENDTEIDDFLPAGEDAGVESYLTKWDGKARGGEAARSNRARRRAGKYRFGLFAGSLVLILALVGVVFIAMEAGTRIHSAVTDDSKLRAYDAFLTVVVAQDPQPFESPEKADPDFVLNASLWKVMTESGANYTNYDDAGRTVVPLGDVVDACGELFGPKCSLQPKSPATESFYTYDAAKSQFHIALYSLEGVYEPYTENAKKEGDSVVLRVGYIPPTDPTRTASASSAASSGKPTPAKYMDYVLETNETTKQPYVYAVRKAN